MQLVPRVSEPLLPSENIVICDIFHRAGMGLKAAALGTLGSHDQHVLCAHTQVDTDAALWQCVLCGNSNPLGPSQHSHLSSPTAQTAAVMEYRVAPSPEVAPDLVPPHVVLVLDANMDEPALRQLARSLPTALQVGVAACVPGAPTSQ